MSTKKVAKTTTAKQNPTAITISLPKKDFTPEAIARLKNLVASKKTVLMAMLETKQLEIVVTKDKLNFPWFSDHHLDGETEAYTMLVAKLGEMARKSTRINHYEKPQENLKYAARLFLVRLGFKGDQYKRARALLTRNLTGNSSWKDGQKGVG